MNKISSLKKKANETYEGEPEKHFFFIWPKIYIFWEGANFRVGWERGNKNYFN